MEELPLVSICTPTFNRRPFFYGIIRCVKEQDYPIDKIQWVIIDDGTDKIEDLIKDLDFVTYIKLTSKITLGKKRNLMHKYCKGDIIVYMDDDDYYPPTRVSHAVKSLLNNPDYLVAGSSEMYIYFKHNSEMWRFGPYGKNHSTAGTFAFKKELLNMTSYDEKKAVSEEKEFLKNYTIPLFQLDPMHVILVFSHDHNTFDKRKLIENGANHVTCKSDKKVDEFIKDEKLRNWYLNEINQKIADYEPGLPKYKPDALKQIKEKEKIMQNMLLSNITIQKDGKIIRLTNKQVIDLIKEQGNKIADFQKLTNAYKEKLKVVLNVKKELQKFYDEYNEYFKNNCKILGPEN